MGVQQKAEYKEHSVQAEKRARLVLTGKTSTQLTLWAEDEQQCAFCYSLAKAFAQAFCLLILQRFALEEGQGHGTRNSIQWSIWAANEQVSQNCLPGPAE